MSSPSLKTSRLVLRGLKPEDAPRVQLLAGDREIADTTLTIPHPFEAGMAEQWIESRISFYESGKAVCFAVILAAKDILVGVVSLKKIDQIHRNAELGYWIGKEYWNNGYATEAAVAVVNYGFRELGLQRIYAHCISRNPSSSKVLSKLDMTHEGTLRQHILKWNEFEDVDLYGILRSEHRLGESNLETDH